MNKLDTRQKVLLVVLGLTIVYFLYDYGFLSFGSDEPGIGMVQPESSASSSNSNKADVEKIKMYVLASGSNDIRFDGDWNNDPFFYAKNDTMKAVVKDKEEKVPETIFELVGISWQGGFGYALIGEDILQENDIISGYIVEKISSDYVILSKGDSTIKLTMNN